MAAAGQRAVTARVGDPFSIKSERPSRGFEIGTEGLGEFTKAVRCYETSGASKKKTKKTFAKRAGFPG